MALAVGGAVEIGQTRLDMPPISFLVSHADI